MLGIRRHPVDHHRIQNGEAIISITLVKGTLFDKDGISLTWTGDGYKLLEELTNAIEKLEDKARKERGIKRIPD
jgi:hypothetical protein